MADEPSPNSLRYKLSEAAARNKFPGYDNDHPIIQAAMREMAEPYVDGILSRFHVSEKT